MKNLTVWVNSKKTRAMIKDGKRTFLGIITKKQFDLILQIAGEDSIIFNTGDTYFKEYYIKSHIHTNPCTL